MFYKTNVDISNTKSMWNFLKEHFTYYTMNSWNRQESIANNVKLYNLNLDGDWTTALNYLTDAKDCGGLQDMIDGEIHAFNEEYYPNYRVGFNGRSSGYLVIYNADDNCSVLPPCVTSYDTYEDFKEDVKSYWNGYNVSDFNRELRDAVELVRDFDKLCDSLRDLVNEYSKRSFDSDKLEAAIEWFNNEYGDELVCLELTGPVMEGDRVKLNDLESYKAYMTCFMICLGEDHRRATGKDGYLWLKEA
jgi:hypothetical protein